MLRTWYFGVMTGSSVAAFEHWVGRWTEIGIDELALYFPPELLWRRELVDERVLERLRELLAVTTG